MSTKGSRKTKKPLSGRFRQINWAKHVGTQTGACLCFTGCGKEITQLDFECGHIIAEAHGGASSHSNIVPICSKCNRSMGTESMVEYCSRHNWTPRADLARLLDESRTIGTASPVPDIASPTTSATPPAAGATSPAITEFRVELIDVAEKMRAYKKLTQLDRAMGRYKRAADSHMRGSMGDYISVDSRFHRDLINDFLSRVIGGPSFGSTYFSRWGEPGSGKQLIMSILQILKQHGCNPPDRTLIQRNIDFLDEELIKYIDTMRGVMPRYKVVRTPFGDQITELH